MSFKRYEVWVTPRALTPEKRAFLGTDRACVLVHDMFYGREIPAEGSLVHVVSEEQERTLARQERDGDVTLRPVAQAQVPSAHSATAKTSRGSSKAGE